MCGITHFALFQGNRHLSSRFFSPPNELLCPDQLEKSLSPSPTKWISLKRPNVKHLHIIHVKHLAQVLVHSYDSIKNHFTSSVGYSPYPLVAVGVADKWGRRKSLIAGVPFLSQCFLQTDFQTPSHLPACSWPVPFPSNTQIWFYHQFSFPGTVTLK